MWQDDADERDTLRGKRRETIVKRMIRKRERGRKRKKASDEEENRDGEDSYIEKGEEDGLLVMVAHAE